MTTLGQNWLLYQETLRSNQAREAETLRHNREMEKETYRSNLAKEAENNRAATANEALKERELTEKERNNRETERWNRAQTAFKYAHDQLRQLVADGLLGQEVLNDFVGVVTGLIDSYKSGEAVVGDMSNNITQLLNSVFASLGAAKEDSGSPGKKKEPKKVDLQDSDDGWTNPYAGKPAITKGVVDEYNKAELEHYNSLVNEAVNSKGSPKLLRVPKILYQTRPEGTTAEWQTTSSIMEQNKWNNSKVRAGTDYVQELADAINSGLITVPTEDNESVTEEEQALLDARQHAARRKRGTRSTKTGK